MALHMLALMSLHRAGWENAASLEAQTIHAHRISGPLTAESPLLVPGTILSLSLHTLFRNWVLNRHGSIVTG